MPLKVLFVRHGESQANLDRVFENRVGLPGDLTPAGVAHAHALAQSLAPEPVTRVYTSPLARARQTAEIIATTLGVPATITDALREYDVGDFEGKPYPGSDAWRWERYERIERAWRDGSMRPVTRREKVTLTSVIASSPSWIGRQSITKNGKSSSRSAMEVSSGPCSHSFSRPCHRLKSTPDPLDMATW